MKGGELLRLVWLNLTQNKFKVVLTSIGIVVGAATIFLVIAIGKGGQMDVAEQFKTLNAGAIDISYEGSGSASSESGSDDGVMSFEIDMSGGGMDMNGGSFTIIGGMDANGGADMGGGMDVSGGMDMNGGADMSSGMDMNGGADMSGGRDEQSMGQNGGGDFLGGFSIFDGLDSLFGFSDDSASDSRINAENVTLTEDDMDDLLTFVPGLEEATITATTKSSVEGGNMEAASDFTIAGTLSNYASISNLTMEIGEYISESNTENKERVCVLGASAAEEIFGSAEDAYDEMIYIDGRAYVVNGVICAVGDVSSGISIDDAIFIPYQTMVKYITGTDSNPTITVIAEDLNNIDAVMENIVTVLAESYPNTEFTLSDAGSKMEAASASNKILTLLLTAMATIVFVVGGIGIMNVLSLSVKERTQEIGILKSIGCSKKDILLEFLLEACFISLLGGVLGVGFGALIKPIVEYFDVRVEASFYGGMISLVFAVLTGTVFGFYPAWKASRLVPVDALSEQ